MSQLPYTFTLNITCPSVNSLYTINYRTREISLKKDVRIFKYKVKTLTPYVEVPKDKPLRITIDYYSDRWFTKDGNIRNADIQNIDKAIIDSISEKLGIRDCNFFSVTRRKIVSNSNSKLVVSIDIL